jgi:hypothetical protein
MEIRDHAKERYVQRVMGIKDIKEARKYVKENEFEVCYRLLEFINKSSVLYKSYAPTRKETFDYYINGEVLIVMGKEKSEVITLYHVTLDSRNKINTMKIKKYIGKIRNNNNIINTLKGRQERQDKLSEHLEYMIDRLDGVIEVIEFEREMKESIEKCKELATQTKQIRMENRKMMSEMFAKIDMK